MRNTQLSPGPEPQVMAQAVTDISLSKLPPYNVEAEQSVLGACVKSVEAVAKALEVLTAEDFYKSSHQKIFVAIRALFEGTEAIDVLTIAEKLRKKSEYEAVGGMDYLDFLEGYVPTAAAVFHHAKIVREKKILRDLIETATDIVTTSYGDAEDVETILDRAEQAIFQISERKSKKNFLI